MPRLATLAAGVFLFGPAPACTSKDHTSDSVASDSASDSSADETGSDTDSDSGSDTAPDTGAPCVPAGEVCNGEDDDCDGQIDEEGGVGWYLDADGDTWGDPASYSTACEMPEAAVSGGDDCDDTDPSVHPGAEETWYDGIDGDCAGGDDFDQDGDGDPAVDGGGTDCRDRAPLISGDRCQDFVISQNGYLSEIKPDGTIRWTERIEHPDVGNLDAHGVRVSDDGRFVVFNGQTTSHDTTYISVWSEADASWTHIAGPTDWEIGGNIAYGEMGIDGSTVWAPANGSDGAEGGIVEADIDAATSTFTALSDGYIQTFLGFDGWLYAQGTTTAWNIDVYDPGTLVLDRSFRFPHLSDPRSFAIAVDGTIYAADWDGAVVRYDAMGTEEARLSVGVGDPVSIDLSTDGRIVVGGRFGEIAITDTTLGSVSALSLTSYVTFVDWIAP